MNKIIFATVVCSLNNYFRPFCDPLLLLRVSWRAVPLKTATHPILTWDFWLYLLTGHRHQAYEISAMPSSMAITQGWTNQCWHLLAPSSSSSSSLSSSSSSSSSKGSWVLRASSRRKWLMSRVLGGGWGRSSSWWDGTGHERSCKSHTPTSSFGKAPVGPLEWACASSLCL